MDKEYLIQYISPLKFFIYKLVRNVLIINLERLNLPNLIYVKINRYIYVTGVKKKKLFKTCSTFSL